MSTDNKQSLPAITLAAIGVVYGDIGTSPLYTLRECLSGQFGFGVERDAVFGFLSLIFWLLILTVSLKYITFVMRADNAGEGGILTLMSLAGRNTSARATSILVILGLIGGSFLISLSIFCFTRWCRSASFWPTHSRMRWRGAGCCLRLSAPDRKSTRLNSSHRL